MADMKSHGVRVAYLEVVGRWNAKSGFIPQGISRVIYRRNYDGPDLTIENANQLASIRESGLEGRLKELASDVTGLN
jgi:hypothetical protein